MILDCAIIGGGPAGLTAGLYTTRGGLENVTMFEPGMAGGQITGSSEIENYPGQAEVVSGLVLMEKWPEQCQRFGLKHEMKDVAKVSKSGDHFQITLGDGSVQEAKSVIVATGSVPRRAGFKGEDEFFGRGISTCATCDGFFYKGKEVAMIGGGDAALEEALYMANIASKVYLIHRRDTFRSSPATIKRVEENKNIEIIYSGTPEEVYGDQMGVTGLKVKMKDGSVKDLTVPGVFIFVGRTVKNSMLKNEDGTFICDTTPNGEVIVDLKMNTNVKGLFAAGDIRVDAPKQVVCAAGDGAVAALQVISYIEEMK